MKSPEDKERDSSDNSYEDDETSLQQSMECDSVIDVTEDDSSEQYVEQDQSVEDNNISNTSNTGTYIYIMFLVLYSMSFFLFLDISKRLFSSKVTYLHVIKHFCHGNIVF